MDMNKIQFQKGMSLEAFHRDYGTVEQCEEALVGSRSGQSPLYTTIFHS
jgi:hypothetical protein